MAKTSAKPVRYDKAEWALISDLKKRTKPPLSVSEISRRAVRFAVPKMLTGELPISDTVLLPSATKRAKKSGVSA